jgi:hypothetical protein
LTRSRRKMIGTPETCWRTWGTPEMQPYQSIGYCRVKGDSLLSQAD